MKRYYIIEEQRQCKFDKIDGNYEANWEKNYTDNNDIIYYCNLQEAQHELALFNASIEWDSQHQICYETLMTLFEEEYSKEDDEVIENVQVDCKCVDFDYINENYTDEEKHNLWKLEIK